jgi:methyl-accepting chemotaxis protein
MSEENKTENPYTNTAKLSDYEVTQMLSKVKDGDMQVIARLLVEMKNENAAVQKRVKMQSIFSLCASGLCLIILIIMLVTVKSFIPQVEAAVANANTLILSVNDEVTKVSAVVDNATGIINQASESVTEAGKAITAASATIDQVNGMMGEVQDVVTNLDKSTQELAAININEMLDNVNSLVSTSEKSVQDTVKKIDDVDLNSLNKAIKDLSTIISPLAKLFRK